MGNRTRIQTARSGVNFRKIKNKCSYIRAHWFSRGADFSRCISQDYLIESIINDFVKKDPTLQASLEKIEISRSSNAANVDNIIIMIYCSKPSRFCKFVGVDDNGEVEFSNISDCSKLRDKINKRLLSSELSQKVNCDIRVIESNRPESNAKLIANQISALMIERDNKTYNRFIRSTLRHSKMFNYGIRIEVAGRIGGSAIARREVYKDGSVKLSTLSRSIDFAIVHCNGKVGVYGIKVWIDKGGWSRA
jgi:small subunit ribosomal protein S3